MRKILISFVAMGLSLASCGDDTKTVKGRSDGGGTSGDGGMTNNDGGMTGGDSGVADAGADLTAPGAVTDFQANAAPSGGIDLSWTPPNDLDLAGTLLVVGQNVPIDFAPTDGEMITMVGDIAGFPGQSVLSTDNAITFGFLEAVPGVNYNFAAWAFDADFNYSLIATTAGSNNVLGPQTATLSIDLATQVVTVMAAAQNLTLSATAIYDDVADTIEIDTTVQNDTGRLLFNLKGLSTAINQGTQSGNLFPIVGGQPSTYFGPESLAIGAQVARTISLTGIDGTIDPITVDLNFVDAPMIYGGNYGGDYVGIDSSGSTEGFEVDIADGQQVRQLAMSPNGRFIYAVGKNETGIITIDTTTNTSVAGADLSSDGLGSGGGIAISNDGADIYVGYNDGAHYHGGDNEGDGAGNAAPDLDLIKFDDDLVEQGRITLATATTDGRTIKNIEISPDGSKLAVVVRHVLQRTISFGSWIWQPLLSLIPMQRPQAINPCLCLPWDSPNTQHGPRTTTQYLWAQTTIEMIMNHHRWTSWTQPLLPYPN